MNPQVSIIMGSTSDLPIMEQAAKLLDEFEIPFEINALSAHRTPDQAMEFARKAAGRGIKVIIAGAGGGAPSRGCGSTHSPAGDWSSHQSIHLHRRLGFNIEYPADAPRDSRCHGGP